MVVFEFRVDSGRKYFALKTNMLRTNLQSLEEVCLLC